MPYLSRYCQLFTLILLLAASTLYGQEQLQYDIHVKADLQGQQMITDGTLSFKANTDTRDSVIIYITRTEPQPEIRLLTKGITILKTTATAEADDYTAYRLEFSRPVAAGTMLTFSYHIERGANRTFQYYIDSTFCMAGGYGTAWYPQVMAPAADGSRSHVKGTGTITVTTAARLTSVVTASTFESKVSQGMKTTRFTCAQPDIFSLYIGEYNRHDYTSNVPFYSYNLRGTPADSTVPAKAAAVLQYLATQFGPLKVPNFSIIEFPENVSSLTGIGGASLLGGVLMPTSAIRRFNYALFGHELSHQWWGNLIISRGKKGNGMVSEALAQYGSLQTVAHFDSAGAMLYRKTGYPGYIPDQSGFGYLKNVAAGNDEPLVSLTGGNDHIIGDSKGFMVLELLAATVGKPLFHATLRKIVSTYSATGLSWENFLQEIDKAHGSSLDWFYQQWFERLGAPAWQSSWQQQQQTLQLTITQTDSIYRLPLEVAVTYTNGETVMHHINIQEKISQLQLPVNGQVQTVVTDPHFRVLHWDDSLKPAAIATSKVTRVQQLRIAGKSAEAEKLANTYLQEDFGDDKYGVQFSLLYLSGRMKGNQQKNDEALRLYKQALQCTVQPAELLALTYYRIAQIAVAKKDNDLLKWASDNALRADAQNNNNDHMEDMIRLLQVSATK
ncbi:MAG TPA: M1 family aminopeptidase [Chitinophaga sp.]|uniref:M1 family aminopeptidase n=1 Tax=Chitinophaga sp. TaxID=1869181 RepID=UPI002B799232|nr:M1 family aminopeptidase [Chitinophaga sp.]HVI46416.1 M1 family aminopeptidase [Chitinophaga sp.]